MSNRKRIVTDQDVEDALSFLRDSAGDIGEAKRRVVSAGHWMKHVEALETKLSSATSVAAKKVDALCSQRYIEAMDEDARAAGEFEKLKALREAASATIESWRSEGANYRAMRL